MVFFFISCPRVVEHFGSSLVQSMALIMVFWFAMETMADLMQNEYVICVQLGILAWFVRLSKQASNHLTFNMNTVKLALSGNNHKLV